MMSAIFYEVIDNNGKPVGEYWGEAGNDLWKSPDHFLTEENGWHKVKLSPQQLKAKLEARLKANKKPGIVIEIVNKNQQAVKWYGMLDGDLWESVDSSLNELNGWERLRMSEAQFRAMIASRSYRLRINALSGKYQYENV